MKVYLHTFGCKANQYDTELVRQSLESAGASVVADPAAADVAVVNSCTVTHTGESRMRSLVRKINRSNPNARTIVMGCAAAVDDGAIERLPGVAAVIGGSDPRGVLDAAGLDPESAEYDLRSFARGARAWLKVQDGCDEHCTFCATTVARGASRSRSAGAVVEEARVLAESHAEIVITGVHIGSYGVDIAPRTSLGGLMATLVDSVPEVRFRLSSVEATEVDEPLLELMAECPERLAPHLHAPLQSGSDRILRLMGRHWYSRKSYMDRVAEIAGRVPRFGLGADVMVGFPGETDADFAHTREVVSETPFTYLHVFPYSERPVAAAQRIGPPVDPLVTAARSEELRAIVAAKRDRYECARDGEAADVVVTARRLGSIEGLTEDYLTVSVGEFSSARFDAELELLDGALTAHAAAGVPA